MGKYSNETPDTLILVNHWIANELAEANRLKRIEIGMMEMVGVDESNRVYAVGKLRKDLEDQA